MSKSHSAYQSKKNDSNTIRKKWVGPQILEEEEERDCISTYMPRHRGPYSHKYKGKAYLCEDCGNYKCYECLHNDCWEERLKDGVFECRNCYRSYAVSNTEDFDRVWCWLDTESS